LARLDGGENPLDEEAPMRAVVAAMRPARDYSSLAAAAARHTEEPRLPFHSLTGTLSSA
jgi:hypothetical protein